MCATLLLLAACTSGPPAPGAEAHAKSAPVPSEAWRFSPGQAGAGVGSSVAGAGDVNGDGYDDIVVGARYYDDGETDEGAAMLFLGSASGPPPRRTGGSRAIRPARSSGSRWRASAM